MYKCTEKETIIKFLPGFLIKIKVIKINVLASGTFWLISYIISPLLLFYDIHLPYYFSLKI